MVTVCPKALVPLPANSNQESSHWVWSLDLPQTQRRTNLLFLLQGSLKEDPLGFRRRDVKTAVTDNRLQRWRRQHCQSYIYLISPLGVRILDLCSVQEKKGGWAVPYSGTWVKRPRLYEAHPLFHTQSPVLGFFFFFFFFIPMKSSFDFYLPLRIFFFNLFFFVLSIIFWLMRWWGDWRKERLS